MLESKNSTSSANTTRDAVNIKLIEALGRIANKGMQSVIDVISRIGRNEFSFALTALLEKYSKFVSGISDAASEYDVKIKDIGAVGRLSSKIGLTLSTLADSSEEHIAGLLFEEITSDMTETMGLLREFENSPCSEQSLLLAREFAEFHEEALSKIKEFL